MSNNNNNNNNEQLSIFAAGKTIDSIRNSGYKSACNAIAELVDNSIQAHAKNIQMLLFERNVKLKNRTMPQVNKICVYDDGDGMDIETVKISLRFGEGTRHGATEGLGKFGMGLPLASVSQVKRVTVYSWQKGNCYKTYIDIDEIRNNDQDYLPPVVKSDIPMDYLKHVNCEVSKEHGTLVIWEKPDRVREKRAETLHSQMTGDMCRIYRHYLDDNEEIGKKVNLKAIIINEDDINMTPIELPFAANDPMYLLTPNTLPDCKKSNGEIIELSKLATNDIVDEYDMNVEYEEGKYAKVGVTFSMVKDSIITLAATAGATKFGQHYRANEGISFLRAGREIDFGSFGFMAVDSRSRWVSCEIRFEAILDRFFEVSMDKQSINGFKYYDPDTYKQEDRDIDCAFNSKVDLSDDIKKNLNEMLSKVRSMREKPPTEKPTQRSTVIANDPNVTKGATKAKSEGAQKTKEEIEKEWIEKVTREHPNIEKPRDIARGLSELEIYLEEDSWKGEQFLDVQVTGRTNVVSINKSHPFYSEIVEKLPEGDSFKKDALELLLYAYAQATQEIIADSEIVVVEKINSAWGRYVKEFLRILKERS